MEKVEKNASDLIFPHNTDVSRALEYMKSLSPCPSPVERGVRSEGNGKEVKRELKGR